MAGQLIDWFARWEYMYPPTHSSRCRLVGRIGEKFSLSFFNLDFFQKHTLCSKSVKLRTLPHLNQRPQGECERESLTFLNLHQNPCFEKHERNIWQICLNEQLYDAQEVRVPHQSACTLSANPWFLSVVSLSLVYLLTRPWENIALSGSAQVEHLSVNVLLVCTVNKPTSVQGPIFVCRS